MALPTASDNVFPKIIGEEVTTPANPAAGTRKLYAKTDGWYDLDDAGTETGPLGGSTGDTLSAVQAIEPFGGTSMVATSAFSGANQGVRRPIWVPKDCTITGVQIVVTNASGNVSVALYDSALDRLATSGSTACPAAGHRIVTFSASYAATAGLYWIAMSCDNTTATFQQAHPTGQACPFAQSGATHHPLPDPFTGTSLTRAPWMAATVSSGLSITS